MAEFEKYGVSEDLTIIHDSENTEDAVTIRDTETAQFTEEYWCPWCGKLLVSSEFTNVLICSEHGTAPFETLSSV